MPSWVPKFFLYLILIAIGGFVLYFLFLAVTMNLNPVTPRLPTVSISTSTPRPETSDESATHLAEAGHVLPTQVVNMFKEGDLAGIQTLYNSLDGDAVAIFTNTHTMETSGVGDSVVTVENAACGYIWPFNKLCKTATIDWAMVYRGSVSGGFKGVLVPQFSFKGDWTEDHRSETETSIDIYQQSTVIVTYEVEMCVTTVEEKTPTIVHTGEEKPDDVSYWFLRQDDRLLPDIGPYRQEMGVNEEGMRIDAYKKAKLAALRPDQIAPLFNLILADISPDGALYKQVSAIFTPEVAKQLHVKGFEIVINHKPITDDSLKVRCDGSLILK